MFGTLIIVLFYAAVYVWASLAFAAVFRKSGVEGWKAWVPILNTVVLFQLAGLSPWLLLLLLVPVLGQIAFLVVFAMAMYRLSVAFGYGMGMAVLGFLLCPVWATIVGFGSARWVGHETVGSGVRRASSAIDDPPPLPTFTAHTSATVDVSGFAPRTPVYSPVPPAPTADSAEPGEPPATLPRSVQAPAAGWAPPPLPSGPADAASGIPPIPPIPPAPVAADAAAAVPAAAAPSAASPAEAAPAPVSAAARARAAAPEAQPVDDPWLDLPAESTDLTGEVTAAEAGAPAPIAAVPSAPVSAVALRADEIAGYAGDLPPVTRVPGGVMRAPAAEPWAPQESDGEADAFPESSGPVSAIAGAPDAGSPRSAAGAVSAQHVRPEVPETPEDFDETVVAARRRTKWSLVLPAGSPVELTGEIVLVGRRPARSTAYPGAQLVVVDDGTVSRTHLRLERDGDQWSITDLQSTNGTVLLADDGSEREIAPGTAQPAPQRWLAGDAELRLTNDTAS
ncbi:hypothetical protein JOD63_002284 [Microbacterium terrae]|uniref:DUF5684 domain-containing protein n=1 Tax=Microbacterium terrae TaxID=69369 RepID=UPI0005EC5129|nr:DUF5684 domain-containing protein [Microbacterium terrae]MBP1078316.1 hypothetical protein [Microbacterium terrae]